MDSTSATAMPKEELDSTLNDYQAKLDDLRKDGVFKLRNLKDENKKIKKDKGIEKEVKSTLVSSNKEEMARAQKVIRQNREDIHDIVNEAKGVLNTNYKVIYEEKVAELKAQKEQVKAEHEQNVEKIKADYNETYANLEAKYKQKELSDSDKQSFNAELSELRDAHKVKLAELNAKLPKSLSDSEEATYKSQISSLQSEKRSALSKINEEKKSALNELKASSTSLSKEELKEKTKNLNADYRHQYFTKENEFDENIEKIQGEYNSKLDALKSPVSEQIQTENASFNESERALYVKYGLIFEDGALLSEKKTEFNNAKVSYKNALYEEKQSFKKKKTDIKDAKHEAYQYRVTELQKLTDNHIGPWETIKNRWENYCYNFKVSDFFLRNGLYIIIIIFFIYAIIGTNGNILTGTNIVNMLTQISTKLFYSLGVGALLLLGGTDLSIGRITALGACITLMCCGTQVYDGAFFGGTINIIDYPDQARIIIGLLMSICACTFFTAIAGFFTAKFKMHPFITSLSTQLIMFGLMLVYFTSYSAFNVDQTIRTEVLGPNQWYLILYAVAAVIIVWFIWNKTKFGKNIYAVGGNSEAASVSGISVFWTTFLVFIMAGILYGCGGFLEGLRSGTANSNLGSGTELDAIAACVIGGISFSGGVGKVRGAVVGTIIFTCLTYCLTSLGFNTNIQYIVKGVIIMVAVCLDSLKYLKKK